MRLAGIDIGTLTCRLLIADVSRAGQLEERFSDRRILRLGEGVDHDKRLKEEAISHVVETIREWQTRMHDHQVEKRVAVATSAVREAKNRDQFLAQVRTETGLDVEVLSGEEEARRTMVGIQSGLPSGVSDILGIDIGGGSTEFILGRQGQDPIGCSVELGVVRLTERILRSNPPTANEIKSAEELVYSQTANVQARMGDLSDVTLVGTAGTVTTLAAMAQNLSIYDPVRIHNFTLDLAKIREIEKDLIGRTQAERMAMLGLEPERADVIVAGTLILRCTMESLGFDQCLVSDYGLREGIVVDLAKRTRS